MRGRKAKNYRGRFPLCLRCLTGWITTRLMASNIFRKIFRGWFESCKAKRILYDVPPTDGQFPHASGDVSSWAHVAAGTQPITKPRELKQQPQGRSRTLDYHIPSSASFFCRRRADAPYPAHGEPIENGYSNSSENGETCGMGRERSPSSGCLGWRRILKSFVRFSTNSFSKFCAVPNMH